MASKMQRFRQLIEAEEILIQPDKRFLTAAQKQAKYGNRAVMQEQSARTRLAVDIGGTFTDLVLALPDRTLSTKLLTTHAAPDEAVIAGTATILREAGIPAASLDLVIHGTTLATNALIERKGARTALITTAGFRDSLEIAYEHRFEQYDLYMERPEPLVSRDLRLEVPERLAADGSVLLELDEAALEHLVPMLQQHDIEALAISFLHSYINPAHEERAREVIARRLPRMAVTISSEVCREIREYERTSTVVANAYVLPMMERYLARMQDGLASHRRGMPAAADDVVGRHLHGGDGAAFSGAPGRERTGGWRHPGTSRRRARRLRSRDLVRHGRHDGEAHADRRLHAAAVAAFRSRADRIASPRAAAFRCASR